MKILAFDCATGHLSVAVSIDGRVAARHEEPAARGQGERLLPAIAATLAAAGLAFGALDRIAVTVGPGHFTGLRVGLAAARGFRVATGLPVIGVTTLEALAHGVAAAERVDRAVLAAVDSKRAEPYFQLFDAALAPLGPPVATTPEDFAAAFALPSVLLAGDDAVRAALTARGVDVRPTAVRHPDAAIVASLAAARDVGEALTPFYLHPAAVTRPRPVLPGAAPEPAESAS
jgi:tRNA threonylcarbamoyladenosine biosynthesis protein TsaB